MPNIKHNTKKLILKGNSLIGTVNNSIINNRKDDFYYGNIINSSLPPTLPNSFARYIPTLANVSLNAGAVATLKDSKGSYDLTQPSGSQQPIWNSSDVKFNAKPSISFNGLNSALYNLLFSLPQPYTIYVVCNKPDLSAGEFVANLHYSVVEQSDTFFVRTTGNGELALYTANLQFNSGLYVSTDTQVLIGIIDGSNSVISINGQTVTGALDVGIAILGMQIGLQNPSGRPLLGSLAHIEFGSANNSATVLADTLKLLTYYVSSIYSGLAAVYKLNGNFTDYLGVNNGINNGVTFGTGVSGQCGVFNGTSCFRINNWNEFPVKGTNDFSISCWFKTNSNSTIFLLGQENSSGAINTLSLEIDISSGTVVVYLGSNTNLTTLTGTRAVNDSIFHNLIFTRKSNTLTLLLDGTIELTANYNLSINDSSNKIGIGAAGEYVGGYFNGSIDEVYIYNRALTSDEITQLQTKFLFY